MGYLHEVSSVSDCPGLNHLLLAHMNIGYHFILFYIYGLKFTARVERCYVQTRRIIKLRSFGLIGNKPIRHEDGGNRFRTILGWKFTSKSWFRQVFFCCESIGVNCRIEFSMIAKAPAVVVAAKPLAEWRNIGLITIPTSYTIPAVFPVSIHDIRAPLCVVYVMV